MALESYFEEIILLFDKLRKANENFLINSHEQEDFEKLVDIRSEYFDELDIAKNYLIDELAKLKSDTDYYSMELSEIIGELPKLYPDLLQYRNKVIEALQNLMESERNVSECMTDLKDDIKKELSHARTGKKTLNAYKPVTGYAGSHFIDSKK